VSNATFPVTLNRQDGSEILNGELTALGGLPGSVAGASVAYVLHIGPAGGPYDQSSFNYPTGTVAVYDGSAGVGAQGTVAIPVTTYAEAADICLVGDFTASNIPDIGDGLDLFVNIVIASLDGTEVGQLTGTVSIAAGTATGTLAPADLTFTAVTGVDLVWTVGTGLVSTTAGGEFGVLASFAAQWN
jgi:hypothetical protein